jgi:anti-anti-sigma factor
VVRRPSSQFFVDVERHRDLRVVRPVGELDISTAGELTSVVESECCGQADLVVDLSGLVFLDCAGLRVLLYAHALANSNGRSLRLIAGPTIVQRIFHLTGLHHRFSFISSAADPASPALTESRIYR